MIKKIVALAVALCAVFGFAGCGKGNKKDTDSVVGESVSVDYAWKGYEEMPFDDFLEKTLTELCGTKVNVNVSKGWNAKELDDSKYDETFTYTAVIADKETDSFQFFMSVEGDVLVTKGGVENEADGDREFEDAEDTDGFLLSLVRYAN